MAKKTINTCTQDNFSVSVTSGFLPNGKVILNVRRCYPNRKNEFGGIGMSKKTDHDGKVFNNSDEAFEFALSRGYIRLYFKKSV